MHPSALSVSNSTLLHASLAYLSPQVQCFNNIIARSPLHKESILSEIPPEVLLIIRSHLVPAVINRLRGETETALKNYESSLRTLLCTDCVTYNEQIFGADLWHWEQFSGPCACSEVASNGNRIKRVLLLDPEILKLDPRQFPDQHAWVEAHLSAKALRFSSYAPSTSLITDTPIWSLVANVLHTLNCEVVHSNATPAALERFIAPGTPWEASRRALLAQFDEHTHTSFVAPRAEIADEWQANTAIRRVCEELGLNVAYETNTLGVQEPGMGGGDVAFPKFTRIRKLQPPAAHPRLSGFDVVSGALVEVFQTAFALPLSLATMLVSVVYIYLRPGALLRVM